MKPKSPKSLELYDIMIKRGYPAEFCDQITKNLNTDWTELCRNMKWKKPMPGGMNF